MRASYTYFPDTTHFISQTTNTNIAITAGNLVIGNICKKFRSIKIFIIKHLSYLLKIKIAWLSLIFIWKYDVLIITCNVEFGLINTNRSNVSGHYKKKEGERTMDAFWRWSMIYKPLYTKPIINTEVTFPYDIMLNKFQAKNFYYWLSELCVFFKNYQILILGYYLNIRPKMKPFCGWIESLNGPLFS